MANIFVVVLGVLWLNIALSDCELDSGRYETAGGGESLSSLIFLSNGDLFFEHEQWNPGKYEERKFKKISGVWSCRCAEVSLILRGGSYSAKLVPIGINPFGIPEDKLVLYVLDSSKDELGIARRVFYKEGLLE
jgi:hypothetical protein